METIVKYRNFQVWFPLVIGIAMIAITVAGRLFWNGDYLALALGFLGAFSLGRGLHHYFNGYAKLGPDYIFHTGIIAEKIYWSNIKKVRKFAGDWIITCNKDKEIFFIPGMLAPESWQLVETYMLELAARKAEY